MRPYYHRVARARATNTQLDDPEIPRAISGGVTGSNGITPLPLGYRPAVWTCSVRCAVYLRARSNIDACLLALVGPGGWPSSWSGAPVGVDGGPGPTNA